jgi:hypothetical protein
MLTRNSRALAGMVKPRRRRLGRIFSKREGIQVSLVSWVGDPYLFWSWLARIMFSEDRVRKGAEKLQKYLNSKQQGRLDGFFTIHPKASPKQDKNSADKGKGKGKSDAKGTKRKVRVSREGWHSSVLKSCTH